MTYDAIASEYVRLVLRDMCRRLCGSDRRRMWRLRHRLNRLERLGRLPQNAMLREPITDASYAWMRTKSYQVP